MTEATTTKETKQNAVYQINFNCDTKSESKLVYWNGNIDEYYMIDYFLVDDCRWVRVPYQTIDDINDIMSNIVENNIKVRDLRINSEKWLSDIRDTEWDEDAKEYKKDNITNRINLFGSRYELISLGITGESKVPDIAEGFFQSNFFVNKVEGVKE